MVVNFMPSKTDGSLVKSWLNEHGSEFAGTFELLYDDIWEGWGTCLAVIYGDDHYPAGFVLYHMEKDTKDLLKGLGKDITPKKITTAYITMMEVHPAYRGTGYGRFLLSSLEAYLRQEGYLDVYVNRAGAWLGQDSESFWWNMGYTDCLSKSKIKSLSTALLGPS